MRFAYPAEYPNGTRQNRNRQWLSGMGNDMRQGFHHLRITGVSNNRPEEVEDLWTANYQVGKSSGKPLSYDESKKGGESVGIRPHAHSRLVSQLQVQLSGRCNEYDDEYDGIRCNNHGYKKGGPKSC